MLELSNDQIHVWIDYPDNLNNRSCLDNCYPLLDEQERNHYHRFKFEKDRSLYLRAHALVRLALSNYAEVKPEDWRFITNPYGKPQPAPPFNKHDLYFNLSHTSGLVACAIGRHEEIGIDVEYLGRNPSILELARSFFAPTEFEELISLTEDKRLERFFEYWTLKEAYIKAKGMGLSIGLDTFWFKLCGNKIRVEFSHKLKDDPDRWQFMKYSPTNNHKLALAARLIDGLPHKITIKEYSQK
jgi:4'-phosphopantetheinyl transferase